MLIRVLAVSTIVTATLVPMQAQQRAQPSPLSKLSLQQWPDEDVHWIITEAERRAYQRMEDDSEREMFISMFWLRRDPTPGTAVNEFREEHYRRLQWAKDRLGGTQTDRAMVFVKFGAPDAMDVHVGDTAGSHYERWTYKYLEGLGQDVEMRFVDPNDTNELKLDWSPEQRERLLPDRNLPPSRGTMIGHFEQPQVRNR